MKVYEVKIHHRSSIHIDTKYFESDSARAGWLVDNGYTKAENLTDWWFTLHEFDLEFEDK